MEKHNEFHTDISQNGTRFRLTFITNDKNNFWLCRTSLVNSWIVLQKNDGLRYFTKSSLHGILCVIVIS